MSRLSLFLLGPPRIERDNTTIKLDTHKAFALLTYISVTGESHRRDSLVNLLWPEYDQIHGHAILRTTISTLKKALTGDYLYIDRESIGLNANADIWVDVQHFRNCIAQCHTHKHSDSEVCPACLIPLIEATELYRDDFLSGFSLKDSLNFDDWQFFQTDNLKHDLANALDKIAQCYIIQGEFESAKRFARRRLSLDRLNESVHCQLMQLYAWSGQRSDALHQYDECVRILKDQLGVSPDESTTKLYEAIKDRHVSSPLVSGKQHQALKAEISPIADINEIHIPESAPITDKEKRIVTILYADVSGSFKNIENNDPENEAILANRFLGVMEDALLKYGGRVNRFMGRNALAVFGAERTHEDDPELAILSAFEIRSSLEKLGLSVSIGINTGEVYCGKIESKEYRNSTLIGAAISFAACLAENAPIGHILVGETTYRLTQLAFEFTPLSLEIKGIGNPVKAYKLEHPLIQPKKTRGINDLRSEMIGRDEELDKLKEILTKVLSGQGYMVSIIGEAGVGKSRLIAELKQSVTGKNERQINGQGDRGGSNTDQPFLWLEGRCLESGTMASYCPFIDMLRDYFAWNSQDDDRRQREKISSHLMQTVERGYISRERFYEMKPFVELLLSMPLEDAKYEELKNNSPEYIRNQTFLAIRDLFIALSGQKPVVLVFEDLHWGDNLSLDLISLLMEVLNQVPLFLVCIYRPEQEHRCWHLATTASQKCHGYYTELYLHEFTPQQSHQILESLLNTENPPSYVNDLILEKAQGNPFFIEELVYLLIDAGILYREGDSWYAKEKIGSILIPESIQNIFLSHFDHLGWELKYILQIASVIGKTFQPCVLEQAIKQHIDLKSVLSKLQDHALIYRERVVPEEEYSFRHVLMQEAVYKNILHSHRQVFHQSIAEAIESLYQNNLDKHYEQLAYHYESSDKMEKAIEYMLKAGEKAKRNSAYKESIAYFNKGLELLKTLPRTPERIKQELDLQIAMGVPLIYTKGFAALEVEELYTQAQKLCNQVGNTYQHFQALIGLRRFYFMRGRLQLACELSEQLLSLAQGMQDPKFLSYAHGVLGETLYWLGQLDQAQENFEQSILYYDAKQRDFYAPVYGIDIWTANLIYKALILWHFGYPDQAVKVSNEGLKCAQELSHPFSLAFAFHFTSCLNQLIGESQTAKEQAEVALRISTEQEFLTFLPWGNVMYGCAMVRLGSDKEGIAQIYKGIEEARKMGAETTLTDSLAFLAGIYVKLGKTQEGLNVLTEAMDHVVRTGEYLWRAELHRLRGDLLVMQGDAEAAEAFFLQAIQFAQSQKTRMFELRAVTDLSCLWQKQGRKKEARELLQGVYNWFTEGFDTADLKDAKVMLDTLSI